MGDDFAALELDTDQDEEMVALFGRSPEPPICSTERNKLTTMGTKSVRTQNAGLNLPSTVNQSCESSKPQTQSLLCITNKRPAAALNQSWPHKARHPTPSANVADPNVSFDDLELDSWEPGGIHTHQASSGTGRQNNNSLSSVAAMALSSQAAGIGGHLQARSNTDSQATEVWQSAYSRPLQTSQASMPVRRASTSQHISYSQQAASAHAAPRHRMTPRGPDISTAMEGLSIPGPAGALHRAQAAGLQIPQLHDLGLHPHARPTASQQHVYQQTHPDFLTAAWQSAMEALDLVCFSGKQLGMASTVDIAAVSYVLW
ncbi:hypothetical protein ABBQ38_004093 [Trebouxia sp. C0009 RCD-2024]